MKKKKKEEKKKRRKFSAEGFYRFLTFFISFFIIVGMLSHDRDDYEWKVPVKLGEPAPRDVYAPFTFSYVDEDQSQNYKREASRHVSMHYKVDLNINASVLSEFDAISAVIGTVLKSEGKVDLNQDVRLLLGEATLKDLLSVDDWETFREICRVHLSSLLADGLMSFNQKVDLIDSDQRMITVVKENSAEDKSILDLKTISEARDDIYRISMEQFPKSRRKRAAFSDFVSVFLKENLVYDDEGTDKARQEAFMRAPMIQETVQKNEIIVRKGKIITYSDLQRFKQIEEEITSKRVAVDIIGFGIIVLFFMIILAAYLYYFETVFYFSLKDIILINAVICFNLILNKFILAAVNADFAIYLIPSSMAALLAAILIKPRLGFCISIGMAIITGVMTDYNGLIMISTLLTSLMGVYMLLDVRRRSQFFVVGALVGLVNFLTIAAFLVLQEMTVYEAFNKALYALGNGGIVIVLLFPLVWLFEKFFDKTTSISLLELSDLNHPLLKRLIIEAPGTYHHSLVVSNLAESAAESIGANSLLARVGSYYHDIGKIEKAAYFTENQTGKDKNFHDNLSPRMSYFIIMNHVKDGAVLARKHKLKNVIIDFIQQHHGSSVVYFFYKKALDELKGDEKLDISDFRYPGPKPQTKEIAITLLADSVEAASRTLSEPTPASLRGLVEKVINDKFLDNQLDECELTLLDLHKIRESFIRNLMAIFHTRVEYPEMISESTQGKQQRG